MATPLLVPFLVATLVPQTPAQEAGPRELLQAHYRAAEAELRAADVGHLDPERRAARARAIEALRAYRERGEFGVNLGFPGWRMPYFVDDEGRRCAVAQLLHADGRDDLVERVAATSNHAFIADLAADAALVEWLDGCGLSVNDAARIQGPALPPPVPPLPPEPAGGWTNGSAPGDARPSAPSGGARGPAVPGPAAPSPGRPGTGGPTLPSIPETPSSPLTDPRAAWWTWWELNKLEYLRANRLEDVEAVYDLRTRAGASDVQQRRGELLALLVELTQSEDGTLRGAACIALGRVGRHEAVPFLRPLLQDPRQDVRQRAILGLGATGVHTAQELLLQLARTGHFDPDARGLEITPDARPLALLALGLGRGAGFGAEVDAAVQALCAERERADRRTLGVAVAGYQRLARAEALWPTLRALATDTKEPTPVRCAALEVLGLSGADADVALLTRMAGERHVDLRRSAALALGQAAGALAVPALKTACELEREPVARGFLLVALGERGGVGELELLVRELREGQQALRPWAALGLGLLGRRTAPEIACKALLTALAGEANADARGAYLLGLGLAADARGMGMADASDVVDAALDQFESANERTRMYAALALALVGTPDARAALLERLALERSHLARVGLLQALGVLGVEGDERAMLAALADMSTPEYQGVVSVSLGLHGSVGALTGLFPIARDAKRSNVARAAAVDSLGMLLAWRPALELARVGTNANFTLFEPWTLDALLTTL